MNSAREPLQPATPASRHPAHDPALAWRQRPLWNKVRWHVNTHLSRRPGLLNALGATLTIVDGFGTPGDTLLTATICRQVRQRYRRLRLNCMTPNPDLLRHDPNIDTVNQPESFFSVWSWYPALVARRDSTLNVLHETLGRLGLAEQPLDYSARVYLTAEERAEGRVLLGDPTRPVVTFHTRTREAVKDWPLELWRPTLAELGRRFCLVHLGDASEPEISGPLRLAGRLTMRQSLSVLAHARVHVGLVSFLMHGANGLGVPAVIVYGGRETPMNSGYAGNINLDTPIACGPCWIHTSWGEHCPHDVACMREVRPDDVVAAVETILQRRSRDGGHPPVEAQPSAANHDPSGAARCSALPRIVSK